MRYAISFAPPAHSLLWQQGSRWLGRDALSGQSLPRPRFRDVDPERIAELTRAPAHYGFHATIVPPFRLMKNISEADLLGRLAEFASRQSPLSLPSFAIALFGSFFSVYGRCDILRPSRRSPLSASANSSERSTINPTT